MSDEVKEKAVVIDLPPSPESLHAVAAAARARAIEAFAAARLRVETFAGVRTEPVANDQVQSQI
jgi:hypothetical protein